MKNITALRRWVLLGAILYLPLPSWADDVIEKSTAPLWGDKRFGRPDHVKGIHLTAWYTGSTSRRKRFEPLFAETELNTAVIDVKEINGEVYIPGVNWPDPIFTIHESTGLRPYRRAIRDIESYLHYLKERGVFTIARLVVFQDQILPKVKPEWAVTSSTPLPRAVEEGFNADIWVDDRGLAWVDPTNPAVHDYIIRIAERAAQLGFQGIQFDYIRFPSDGNTKWCRYSIPLSSQTKPMALAEFLAKADETLKPYGVEISIDTFGLAGSFDSDLGIGQRLTDLVDHIDVLSPMMYPSHYAKGEYGIEDPNKAPYETVSRSVRDTLALIEDTGVQLRPFLQDFSLGVKYNKEKVRAQINAVEAEGVTEWMLWNPRCVYTRKALKSAN